MAYSNKVIDHYENPRNVGSLPKDSQHGTVNLHRRERQLGNNIGVLDGERLIDGLPLQPLRG